MTGRSVPEWIGKTPDEKIPPRVRLRIWEREPEYFLNRSYSDPNCGCWIWLGAANAKGYGHLAFRGRFEKAHRASYIVHKGEIPRGVVVCHSCDTPACVNPDHLWLGTHGENLRDSVAKGRWGDRSQSGQANGSAKISDADVDAIRAEPFRYGLNIVLGERYGLRPSYISHLRRGLRGTSR